MLVSGCALLSVWSVLNLVPSGYIVLDTLFWGGHTPAVYAVLSEAEGEGLGAGTLATLDSIAVFANGCNIAFCLVALAVVWRGLYRRQGWAFGALVAGYAAALAAGVAADHTVGTVAPWVNAVSAAILALGLGLAGLGLRRGERPSVGEQTR